MLVQYRTEIAAVAALGYPGDQRFQTRCVDPAQAIGNFFGTGDLEPLTLLDRLNEDRGFDQRVVRPRVKPRESPAQNLGPQLAPLQILAIHIGDFQLAARRRAI